MNHQTEGEAMDPPERPGRLMDQKHERTEEEYRDQYDRATVEACRDLEQYIEEHKDDFFIEHPDSEGSNSTVVLNFAAWYMEREAGERYLAKKATIAKWRDEDRRRDVMVAKAEPPTLVRCTHCSSVVHLLDKFFLSTEEQVLFLFECPNGCAPRRMLRQDGSDWKPKASACPSCSAELVTSEERTNDVVTVTDLCPQCGYEDISEIDLSPRDEKADPEYEKDRARFCLSDADGQAYAEAKENLKRAAELGRQLKKEQDDADLYAKARALSRLTVPALKKHLAEALAKERHPYTNLVFGEPQLGHIATISFTVEDPTDASEDQSRRRLAQSLKHHLASTNWRLMSDGLSYRLGVLSGRLRAYEREEEIVELLKGKRRS